MVGEIRRHRQFAAVERGVANAGQAVGSLDLQGDEVAAGAGDYDLGGNDLEHANVRQKKRPRGYRAPPRLVKKPEAVAHQPPFAGKPRQQDFPHHQHHPAGKVAIDVAARPEFAFHAGLVNLVLGGHKAFKDRN